MKTLFTCVLVAIVGLIVSSRALAGGKSGKGTSHSHSSYGGSSYHSSYSRSSYHSSSNGSYRSYKGGSPYYTGGSSFRSGSYSNYHLSHGTSFHHGYYYSGRYHNHWSYSYFDKRFGSYLYRCPATNCWYYYCVPDRRYYPVSYAPYQRYQWGDPVRYSSAPQPPAGVPVPEPVKVMSPAY
jgi:hypothetical protein